MTAADSATMKAAADTITEAHDLEAVIARYTHREHDVAGYGDQPAWHGDYQPSPELVSLLLQWAEAQRRLARLAVEVTEYELEITRRT